MLKKESEGDNGVHDFIVKLESSAKRVLEAANKKHREAALLEKSRAFVQSRKAEQERLQGNGKTLGKTGTVMMKTLALSSSMDLGETLALGRQPPGTDTLEMRYSVPRMFVSMAADTTDLSGNNIFGNGRTTTSAGNGGGVSGILSPITKKGGNSGAAALSSTAATASAATTLKRNLVLEKLNTSPLISESMGSLDQILLERRQKQQVAKDKDKTQVAATPEREIWELKSHASNVMSGALSGANKMHKHLMKLRKGKLSGVGEGARKSEMQGPIDWSTNGLKTKYRGELERETAWRSWQSANEYSQKALETQDIVLPIAVIERHPLYIRYYQHIKSENFMSCTRTRTRLLMKRFVLDVSEVWLTNLQHLREHQPARLLAEKREDGTSAEDEDPELQGSGLKDRRDARAIEAMESQIQSVSQKRTLEKAYFTTRMPDPKVVLNYEPVPTFPLAPARPLPPIMEKLIEGLCVEVIDTHGPKVEAYRAKSTFDAASASDVSEVLLFIDRLLPPSDRKEAEQGEVHGTILWRFSAYRREDIEMRYFVVDEKSVVEFAKKLEAESAQREKKPSSSTRKVYSSPEEVLLPWAVMDVSAEVSVHLGLKSDISSRKLGEPKCISIVLRADLKADFEGDVISFVTSPAELRYLLNAPGMPLEDLEWWSSPDRAEEVWANLLSLLYVAEGDVNVLGEPAPVRFVVVEEKTPADRVEGAVSTLRAHTIAQAIAQYVRIDKTLSLVIEDTSPKSFFLYPAPRPKAQAEASGDEDKKVDGNAFAAKSLEEAVQHKQQHNESLKMGEWEVAMDKRASTLSMAASGALNHVAQVPGACEFGRLGLWFPHRMNREYTQASCIYFRDARLSTTNTVFVNSTLALDTSIIFPCILAWEDFPSLPPKCPAEEVDGIIPALVSLPGTLLLEPLKSPLDERMSDVAAIFGTVPEEGLDHIPLDFPRKPKGMMRHWPWKNDKGFRKKAINTLLGVDPVLPTVVFGITKLGAQPNVPSVNTRNIWHSTLAITEHINRPRAPKDYHYMVANAASRGANDPSSFACRMKSGECVGISSSAFQTFEKEYAEIKLRREIFARQLALDAKIENSLILLKTREKAFKALMQKELQRGIEKKLRKATKSEKGWSKRFNTSVLLEIQGNWERRRDERSGTIFFRVISPPGPDGSKKEEKFMETCQWEVPATWDGDPLAVPDDEYGPDGHVLGSGGDDNQSLKSGAVSGIQSSLTGGGAFEQPAETWHPGVVDANDAIDSASAGAKPVFALRATKENVSVLAEKSMSEIAPASIDTANLEHIAEQLVSSDELMRIIARRLGLPESQVVPAEEMSSVFSVSAASLGSNGEKGGEKGSGAPMNAPRDVFEDDVYEPELDSDDDLWSDDEQEAGDYDEDEVGDLPQGHYDATQLRRKKLKEAKGEEHSVPSHVPYLNLKGSGIVPVDDNSTSAMGWRKLPRPDIPSKFFHKCAVTQTLGPDIGSCNTSNVPIFMLPISPVDACQYVPENFFSDVESIFIPDAKKDMERALATVERNIKREEDLARNLPTDDLLLFGQAQEMTAVDMYVAKQYKEDQNALVDPKEKASKKAILAAKSNNIAQMEDALEEDIPLNTADQYGNTLLILAAQQGSKRMCKFLLRRGANINLQSLAGNTALHYCFAYNFPQLGMYLISRGADDTIINGDGKTPYEMADGMNEEEEEEEEGEEEG